jgi:methionyl-tRNA formyltransferase
MKPEMNEEVLQHKYFVIAKHGFYLEDARKSFAEIDLEIATGQDLDELREEILRHEGNCTVFFPHYSKHIKIKEFPQIRLIGFHTGNLPNDRGGSPIQNKILKREYKTQISAFELEETLDTGAIFTQREVDVSQGNIESILRRISYLIASMMIEIALDNPAPTPQPSVGEVNRRITREGSELPKFAELVELYDRIRMVDGLDYPKAFINFENYKVTFSNVERDGETLRAVAVFEGTDK